MYQDHKDLLSSFHARGVKYLTVGGYAVIFYAQPRTTKHIDLFIKADAANAQAAYGALAEFGAPLPNIRPEDLSDRSKFFRFGNDPCGIDILPDIPGVNFDEVWERRVEGVIDPDTGLKAFFIWREDLIAAKLAAGRLPWRRSAPPRRALQQLRPKSRANPSRKALNPRLPPILLWDTSRLVRAEQIEHQTQGMSAWRVFRHRSMGSLRRTSALSAFRSIWGSSAAAWTWARRRCASPGWKPSWKRWATT